LLFAGIQIIESGLYVIEEPLERVLLLEDDKTPELELIEDKVEVVLVE
jgi:hypothetical protein